LDAGCGAWPFDEAGGMAEIGHYRSVADDCFGVGWLL
jgi:hypothetical protein